SAVSLRISQGPASRPIARAVAQASKARNVMYSTTPNARKCSSDSQRASSSNMAVLLARGIAAQCLHHTLHAHAARSFDQDMAGPQGQQTPQQRVQRIEGLGAVAESRRRMM